MYGIDKTSTTATYGSVWRSELVPLGETFWIRELRIPVGAVTDSNVSIIPKIYVDDASTSFTLTTIDGTTFGRYALFKNPELNDVTGSNNFFIELTFNGTTYCPVLLPITADVEVVTDEP
jgi:hypothetical protein